MQIVAAELRSGFDQCALEEQSAFDGGRTNRFNQVLRASSGAAELIEHEWVVAVADEILLPHCANYTVGSMTAIEILPGEDGQALHRDDTIYPLDLAGLELQIGVMWAINDFTAENGATRVVPGSHRYLRSWHLPSLESGSLRRCRTVRRFSILVQLGMGVARTTRSSRIGLINTYCLGWLRQESNQYFENPPSIANTSAQPCARCWVIPLTVAATMRSALLLESAMVGWIRHPESPGAMRGVSWVERITSLSRWGLSVGRIAAAE